TISPNKNSIDTIILYFTGNHYMSVEGIYYLEDSISNNTVIAFDCTTVTFPPLESIHNSNGLFDIISDF
ncbi:MAG: hypothetical protein AABY27_02195, partial [Pseudomonadota bacterium]